MSSASVSTLAGVETAAPLASQVFKEHDASPYAIRDPGTG